MGSNVAQAEVFSVDDLTRRLKSSPRAIRRLITRGRLRAVKIGTSYRITAASLEKFLGEKE